jgi:hypothetical protein
MSTIHINQTFLKKTLIFGDVDKVYKDDVYNAILLNIKYYIYTNRCLKKKLSFHSLTACLINLYKTEKMIAKWHCIHHLYILYQHPQKLESSLKMFGLCLCHRTKNLLALEDFVHFHNPKKCVQLFHFPFGKNYNLHHQ